MAPLGRGGLVALTCRQMVKMEWPAPDSQLRRSRLRCARWARSRVLAGVFPPPTLGFSSRAYRRSPREPGQRVGQFTAPPRPLAPSRARYSAGAVTGCPKTGGPTGWDHRGPLLRLAERLLWVPATSYFSLSSEVSDAVVADAPFCWSSAGIPHSP